MPLFLSGYWPYPMDDILRWKGLFEKKGVEVQILTVPLGHPGNSLGGLPEFESTPKNWPRGVDIDGNKYSGTSVHQVITQENISVIQKVSKSGFNKLFLDDLGHKKSQIHFDISLCVHALLCHTCMSCARVLAVKLFQIFHNSDN